MSEVIKAQAQKVYDARKHENMCWHRQKDLEPRTPQWYVAMDELEHASTTTNREERLLSTLVIEDQLGKVTY